MKDFKYKYTLDTSTFTQVSLVTGLYVTAGLGPHPANETRWDKYKFFSNPLH